MPPACKGGWVLYSSHPYLSSLWNSHLVSLNPLKAWIELKVSKCELTLCLSCGISLLPCCQILVFLILLRTQDNRQGLRPLAPQLSGLLTQVNYTSFPSFPACRQQVMGYLDVHNHVSQFLYFCGCMLYWFFLSLNCLIQVLVLKEWFYRRMKISFLNWFWGFWNWLSNLWLDLKTLITLSSNKESGDILWHKLFIETHKISEYWKYSILLINHLYQGACLGTRS